MWKIGSNCFGGQHGKPSSNSYGFRQVQHLQRKKGRFGPSRSRKGRAALEMEAPYLISLYHYGNRFGTSGRQELGLGDIIRALNHGPLDKPRLVPEKLICVRRRSSAANLSAIPLWI